MVLMAHMCVLLGELPHDTDATVPTRLMMLLDDLLCLSNGTHVCVARQAELPHDTAATR